MDTRRGSITLAKGEDGLLSFKLDPFYSFFLLVSVLTFQFKMGGNEYT